MAVELLKDEDGEMEMLANQVIEEYGLLTVYKPKIGYVFAHPYISKTVVAKCIRANKELKLFSDYDYIIEFSLDVWQQLSNEDRKKVLHHELLHILPIFNEKKNDYIFKILDHDIQDFKKTIKAYGIDWVDNIFVQVESIRDLSPEMKDSLTF